MTTTDTTPADVVPFIVNTPGPSYARPFATVDDAMTWAERNLPAGPRMRRERRHAVTGDGIVHNYARVIGPTGRLRTGAVVFTTDPRGNVPATGSTPF